MMESSKLNIVNEFKEKNIPLWLEYFGEDDYATQLDIKHVLDCPDFYKDVLKENLADEKINSNDSYIAYLLALKLSKIGDLANQLLNKEYKPILLEVTDSAKEFSESINKGSLIRFLNENYSSLFDKEADLPGLTNASLDIINKYQSGLDDELFSYLCTNQGCLFIRRYDDFEKRLEGNPELFNELFLKADLQTIQSYGLDETLKIFEHILNKDKSTLVSVVNSTVDNLCEDSKQLLNNATEENILYIEGPIRKLFNFLKATKDPKANEYKVLNDRAQELLNKSLESSAHSFKYEIPVGEIIQEIKSQPSWEFQLIAITHDAVYIGNKVAIKSRLDHHWKSESLGSYVVNHVSTNIPTDDYFTFSVIQQLDIQVSIGAGTILGLLNNENENFNYLSMLYSAIDYIAKNINDGNNDLLQSADLLLNSIELMNQAIDEDKAIFQPLCYNAAMFCCAFTEKILREIYIKLVGNQVYVPRKKATMGPLLSEHEEVMINYLGYDHLKNLAYYFSATGDNGMVGCNYRNRLAHLEVDESMLTISFVAKLMYLMTDVVNTVFCCFLLGTEKNEVSSSLDEKEATNSSADTHTVITSLDPNSPKQLTDNQRAQLDALANLLDENVRKEAENDPDCEPLAGP